MPIVVRENPFRRKQNQKRNEQPYRKKRSMFECKTPDPKEISSEIVKADCMNHGYRLIRTLGEGAYAKVKLAEVMQSKLARNERMSELSDGTGELQIAIKVIAQRMVPKEFLRKFLPRELDNHANLEHHQHVVQIYETFSTDEHVYIVMDYCSKGDLLDLINKHIGDNQKGIGEALSRKLFTQLCQALRHIHNNGIVHRDLKCENVLLDENMDVKLTDFGFSCYVQDRSSLLKTTCGSYAYTAPEVIKCKPYDGFRSDVWSLGIILFAMANGRLPFNDAQLTEMDEEMKMQRLKFERTISFDCMILIRKLLQYHPNSRPNLTEILEDPWLTGKKPIPRQVNKPKWINPYDGKKSENVDQSQRARDINVEPTCQTMTHKANVIAYKETSQKSDKSSGVVVLNQEAGETVTLKSRVPLRKNIRTIGPQPDNKQVPRPNTWPKPSPKVAKMTPMSTKTYSRASYNSKNVDVNNFQPLSSKNQEKQGDTTAIKTKEQLKSVPLWLIQQIIESQKSKSSHERQDDKADDVKEIEEVEEKPPDPLASCPACNCGTHKPDPKSPSSGTRKNILLDRSGTQSTKACSSPNSPARKPVIKTTFNPRGPMVRRNHPANCQKITSPKQAGTTCSPIKKTEVHLNAPNVSKSSELAKHRVKPSVTPAVRAHSCRERKLNVYNVRPRHEQWPLPPLLVQSLHPYEFEQRNSSCYSLNQRCPSPVTPRNASACKKVGNIHTITPKHKIVVHCP